MKLKEPKKNKKQDAPELELEVENTKPIINGVEIDDEDDTIFYFTNSSDEDWSTQWNKVVYTFPARRRTRMAIRGESPENVQAIRKMFATRYATEMYFKSEDFKRRNTPIENRPPVTYNPLVLQPYIDSCLKPLPKAKLISKEAEKEEYEFTGSTKPLGDGADPYEVFKNDPIKTFGEM